MSQKSSRAKKTQNSKKTNSSVSDEALWAGIYNPAPSATSTPPIKPAPAQKTSDGKKTKKKTSKTTQKTQQTLIPTKSTKTTKTTTNTKPSQNPHTNTSKGSQSPSKSPSKNQKPKILTIDEFWVGVQHLKNDPLLRGFITWVLNVPKKDTRTRRNILNRTQQQFCRTKDIDGLIKLFRLFNAWGLI